MENQPYPNITPFRGVLPRIGMGAYIHPSARIVGDVVIGANSSVWCNAVIRGDVNFIRIGDDTNIQDLCALHVSHPRPDDPGGAPLIIGNRVTVGHSVILHGCEIGDECLIGMGAVIMDKAVVEPQVLVGAGSLVPEGKVLKSGFLYLGRPAKQVRPLTPEEIAHFAYSAAHYVRLAREHDAGA
jgi:carbonic anhydrase/acetyltransferase-like protein (isoleucine patch superfamily)